jgi:ubiquinone/menaquinone biosynthesis C-methylase UbiE
VPDRACRRAGWHCRRHRPVPPVIAYATRIAPPNCTFQVAAAQQLPLLDATFDLVVSSLAIHHIPPDLRPDAVREMLRVLHPGGRLFIADFRPPQNRIANHLIGALSGHAMQHNRIHELEASPVLCTPRYV